MVTDHQGTATALAPREWVSFADVVRVSSPHGAIWRPCIGCDVLAPLAPDAVRCDECARGQA
jgi:hypothetical protein